MTEWEEGDEPSLLVGVVLPHPRLGRPFRLHGPLLRLLLDPPPRPVRGPAVLVPTARRYSPRPTRWPWTAASRLSFPQNCTTCSMRWRSRDWEMVCIGVGEACCPHMCLLTNALSPSVVVVGWASHGECCNCERSPPYVICGSLTSIPLLANPGRCFVVRNKDEFVNRILASWFRQSKSSYNSRAERWNSASVLCGN